MTLCPGLWLLHASRTPAATEHSTICRPRHRFTLRFTCRVMRPRRRQRSTQGVRQIEPEDGERFRRGLPQAIGRAAIQQGYRVIYREAHMLLEELAEATLAGTRKAYLAELATVPLRIIDDVGMRKLPHTAAEDMLELIMRRYECASMLLTSKSAGR